MPTFDGGAARAHEIWLRRRNGGKEPKSGPGPAFGVCAALASLSHGLDCLKSFFCKRTAGIKRRILGSFHGLCAIFCKNSFRYGRNSLLSQTSASYDRALEQEGFPGAFWGAGAYARSKALRLRDYGRQKRACGYEDSPLPHSEHGRRLLVRGQRGASGFNEYSGELYLGRSSERRVWA